MTDYDTIAEEYKLAKQQAWRAAIESYTLMGLVGDPTGQSVIDLACSEGHYTRMLRRRGAARAAGVDLSEGMVALARAEEAARPLGVEYRVGDARDLRSDDSFDLVMVAYLLNYARDRAALAEMCRGIASLLKPGGRFVTVNTNPAMDFARLPSFRRYGFEVSAEDDVAEGAPITWTFHLADGPLRIENYRLGVEAHEEAFRAAGFREVHWHPPQVEGDAGPWDLFLATPPIAFIECVM